MHELSITQNIVNIALRRGREVGASRIKRILVKVGEFTSIEPECLQFYFGPVTKTTAAEGAVLEVETIPLTARCSTCNSPFTPDKLCFLCPNCGSTEIEVTSGRELYVESIEVE